MKYLILLSLLFSGCGTVKPVASVELNYAFPFSVDHWQSSERPWQCEQPQFRLEVGGETKKQLGFGVYHESMVLCGQWNHKPEIFENGIYIKKEWGGWNNH